MELFQKHPIDIMKYKAVLFDLDGVIADSMDLHYLAYLQAFLKYCIYIDRRDLFCLEGMGTKKLFQKILGELDASLLYDYVPELVDNKRANYLSLSRDAKPFPCVIETLSMLREHDIRLALITGTNPDSMKATLKTIGLHDAFDAYITNEDTCNGKPHPDPYLRGMQKLNVPGEFCMVVENAPLGIISAKSAMAGCVVALTTTLPPEYLKCADVILPSFCELKKCLGQSFKANKLKKCM